MKILRTFIFLLLIVSCSSKGNVVEFEKILGKENSETLNLMVSDFERGFLKTKFPNLNSEKAYERILTEISNSNSISWNELPKFDKSRFEQSQLKFEIYAYVDSVWIETNENPMIVTQYKLLDNGTFYKRSSQSSYRPKDGLNNDSIIKNRYSHTDLNYQSGRFWEALRRTCKKDNFILEYLDFANTSGPMQPKIMADKMLDADLNYSDYFIKRIIVTGFSYQ